MSRTYEEATVGERRQNTTMGSAQLYEREPNRRKAERRKFYDEAILGFNQRVMHSQLSKTREREGKQAFEIGLKAGYWPCLKGPFISIALRYRRLDVWYGLPTQWPDGKPPS